MKHGITGNPGAPGARNRGPRRARFSHVGVGNSPGSVPNQDCSAERSVIPTEAQHSGGTCGFVRSAKICGEEKIRVPQAREAHLGRVRWISRITINISSAAETPVSKAKPRASKSRKKKACRSSRHAWRRNEASLAVGYVDLIVPFNPLGIETAGRNACRRVGIDNIQNLLRGALVSAK